MRAFATYSVLLWAYVTLSSSNCLAHDPLVHARITDAAEVYARQNSIGYSNFMGFIGGPTVKLVSSTNGTPPLLMQLGSQLEDGKNLTGDGGGYRQLNHFYDPFNKRGLSDWPLDEVNFGSAGPFGQDSFTWASTLNGPGIGVSVEVLPVPWPIPFNATTSNIWSFQNARLYEWEGLTNSDLATRGANLALMFRCVGQVAHLLQDATSPQHVRNEQHLPLTPWLSPFETYGKKHYAQLNYTPASMLDWRSAGFTQLRDFWDRNLYSTNKATPDPTALDNNEDPSDPTATLGVAEFVNGNFLGERHSYAELTSTNSRFYYPLPSLFNGTDYGAMVSDLASHGKPSGAIPPLGGSQVYRSIVSKTNEGRYVTNHAMIGYLHTMNRATLTNLSNIKGASVDDPDVLADYHYHLIPTAVKYTAGLIDYFFRGMLGVNVLDATNGLYDIVITNTSSQDLSGGNFHLFYDDASGNRTELSVDDGDFDPGYSGALAPGGTTTASFYAPDDAVGYILVYQGTVGTSGGADSDPVDASIAIAATAPAVPTINATLPEGQVGTAYTGSIAADGFDGPTFSITDGALPDGLSLDASSGDITGTPTSPGLSYFTVAVTDSVTGFICVEDEVILVNSPNIFDALVWDDPVDGVETMAPRAHSPGASSHSKTLTMAAIPPSPTQIQTHYFRTPGLQ